MALSAFVALANLRYINALNNNNNNNGSKASSNSDDNDVMNVNQDVDHQAASVACVIEEQVSDEAVSGKDVEASPLYNVRQRETVDDVIGIAKVGNHSPSNL